MKIKDFKEEPIYIKGEIAFVLQEWDSSSFLLNYIVKNWKTNKEYKNFQEIISSFRYSDIDKAKKILGGFVLNLKGNEKQNKIGEINKQINNLSFSKVIFISKDKKGKHSDRELSDYDLFARNKRKELKDYILECLKEKVGGENNFKEIKIKDAKELNLLIEKPF